MTVAVLFGLSIGMVLGLTGAGGGILAVPALVLGLGWSLTDATPVALLAVGLAAALGAADGLRKGLVRWRAALLMAALGIATSPLGVYAAHVLPHKVLMTMFSAAMFAASARLLLQRSEHSQNGVVLSMLDKNCMINTDTGRLRWSQRCAVTLASIGSASGLLTGMLGVGGGFLLVPAFRQWSDLSMQAIVATSLSVVALVSIGTTASALHAGAQLSAVGCVFIASALMGMLVSRRLAPYFSARSLQLGFAWLAAGVAVYLLFRTWLTAT